jgi:hypothetical protein
MIYCKKTGSHVNQKNHKQSVVQTCFVDNGGAQFLRMANPNSTQGNPSDDINSNVEIYPNPANENIVVNSKNSEEINMVSITDITGKEVYNKGNDTDIKNMIIDFSFLQPNTYFVKFSTTNNVYNTKFVIVK